MTTYNYSLESKVKISAQSTSMASSMEDAIAEARLAQSRGAINWDRSGTKIGPIFENFEIWAVKSPDGSWIISFLSSIVLVSTGVADSDSQTLLIERLRELQISGSLLWFYRGTPVGVYRDANVNIWVNEV